MGSSFRAIRTGAIVGSIIVIIGAVAASQTEGPSILGGSALDPAAILAGLGFLTVVSGLAAYWPARRIGIEGIRLRQ
jgi:hypothetical protein